ncbi:MAG: hypothetical protein LBT33_04390, partial [Spirochaetia bacterium]|jgi:hypothetical protein|nr:hypothetical protein [Spirochaetia bacterium]
LERKARFAAFYAANAPKFRIGVELQMGFGTGSHKNRISCDFRFEIGIAAIAPPWLDNFRVFRFDGPSMENRRRAYGTAKRRVPAFAGGIFHCMGAYAASSLFLREWGAFFLSKTRRSYEF